MNKVRASSSPDLIPEAITNTSEQPYDDSALEGVASHVKLLLKLIQDHKDACGKEKNDGRRMLRVATMMTILDNLRERIRKCQSFGKKASNPPELRRCNTDLRRSPAPREKRPNNEPVADEKERLRRELSACLAARKSLEIMCSSLGKEKEIMSGELSKKVYELKELDDFVNDLKVQNEKLLERVQECVSEHNEKLALQERNRVLSDQLLRTVDGYKSMKRKLMLAQEENVVMRGLIDEMATKAGTGLERVRSFKERLSKKSDDPSVDDVQEDIVALENMFECFEMLVDKHDPKKKAIL